MSSSEGCAASGKAPTLHLAGGLGDEFSEQLEVLLSGAASLGDDVVVDLSGVFYISRRCLAALRALALELPARGSRLVVVNPSCEIGRALCRTSEAGDADESASQFPSTSTRISSEFASRVVEQVFAAGLSLAAVQSRLADEAARSRLRASVEQLDGIVREVRDAVFAQQRSIPPSGLRVELVPSTMTVLIRLIGELHALGASYVSQLLGLLDPRSIEMEVSELLSIDAAGVAALREIEVANRGAADQVVVSGARGAIREALAASI